MVQIELIHVYALIIFIKDDHIIIFDGKAFKDVKLPTHMDWS